MSEPQKKYKHFSLNERCIILSRLENRYSCNQIARELGRSPSSISREIRRHIYKECARQRPCKNRANCNHKFLCNGCTSIYRQHCSKCNHCTRNCPDYTPLVCPKLINTSYVCNGCLKKPHCQYEKRFYDPSKAHEAYKTLLHDARSGFNLNEEEINRIDELVLPLIKNGQSPYHILKALKEQIPCSESTLRRLIDSTCLTVRNIDLRHAVKRKVKKKPDYVRLASFKKAKIGHLWEDYMAYMEQYPDTNVVEMDCVKGLKKEPCALLTLYFRKYHLQLAYILDAQTSENVVHILDILESALGTELFQKMFPVILTDNGSEFAECNLLERSINGGNRTTVFYCQPFRSNQKGACERNHELIRYCLPKKTSFNFLTQADVTLMMNHINSYSRKSLENHSPYEYARFMNVPKDFFMLLNLRLVLPEYINLTPSLFSKK